MSTAKIIDMQRVVFDLANLLSGRALMREDRLKELVERARKLQGMAPLQPVALEDYAALLDGTLPSTTCYNTEEDYPPKGTKEEALVVTLDCEQFRVIAHKGRFFHGQIGCAGYSGEEIGFVDVPDAYGFWVFDNGRVYAHEDDIEIVGEWRAAAPADFEYFGVEMPECMADLDAMIPDPNLEHAA